MQDEVSRPTEVWRWDYPTVDGSGLRRAIHVGGLTIVALVALVAAAALQTRGIGGSTGLPLPALVIAVVAIAGAVRTERQHRQAKATSLSLDGNGLLSFTDGKQSATIDLRTCSAPNARKRNHPRSPRSWNWAIEAQRPTEVWSQNLPGLAMGQHLPTGEIDKLNADLAHWTDWATGGKGPQQTQQPSSLTGGLTDSFSWQPTLRHSTAIRQAAMVVSVVAVLGTFGFMASTQAKTGNSGIVISLAFTIFVALFMWIVRAGLRDGETFRIDVEGGLLVVSSGAKTLVSTPLDSISSLEIDTVTSRTQGSSSSGGSTTNWYLQLTADPPVHSPTIPSTFNVVFARDDAITLETQLKQFMPQL